VSDVLNTRVDPQVIGYLFGEGVTPLAYLQITPPKRIDMAKEVDVDTFLLGAGVPLGVDDARERYQRAAPDDGEELLQAPRKPAATAPPGDDSSADATLDNSQAREFAAVALDDVASELSEVLAPVRARLENIAQMQDPAEQVRALEVFRGELPTWLRRMAHADAGLVRAVEGMLGTAMVQGIEAGALPARRARAKPAEDDKTGADK
jgi:hypothetical protein